MGRIMMEDIFKQMDTLNTHAARFCIGDARIDLTPMAWSDNVFLFSNTELGMLQQIALFADAVKGFDFEIK